MSDAAAVPEPIPSGFRNEPDLSVSTASPAACHPDFAKLDRQGGWLLVNKWTYRPLGLLAGRLVPKADLSGVTVSEQPVGPSGMKVVQPEIMRGQGAVLLIHGGGYVLGTNSDVLGSAAMIARTCGVPVFCPSYRTAPQQPFPVALDDCQVAWTWLQAYASKAGIDPTKIVIGGVSAGGGLAAALTQRLHDEGGQQPSAQLLVYPMLDDRTAAQTGLDALRHRVWNNVSNRFGWTSYLGTSQLGASHLGASHLGDGAEGSLPAYAVPARREDLSGLVPAWLGVGTADLFLDEVRDYARRLREAGVAVEYVEVDGGIHGFDSVKDSPLSNAFDESQTTFLSGHSA